MEQSYKMMGCLAHTESLCHQEASCFLFSCAALRAAIQVIASTLFSVGQSRLAAKAHL